MFKSGSQKSQKMLLVGVWANRNWILGNWIKEVKSRAPKNFILVWVPTIFANKRWWEKIAYVPFPKYGSYFFSYITIFEKYLLKDHEKYNGNSIVLYPHNEPEMGTLTHQAKVLNSAFCVYFFCSRDAEELIKNGLDLSKVRLTFCAVDVDCVPHPGLLRESKTVVLASRFGPRKGLEILPDLVRQMPDWRFIGLGRNWETFINSNELSTLTNFEYYSLDKKSRNYYFSKAEVFLSLSNLEGGPVPLIESIELGCKPVSTDTGFARDVMENNGILIPINPVPEQVKSALIEIHDMPVKPNSIVRGLTWDRLCRMMIDDHHKITSNKRGIERIQGKGI